MRVRTDRRIATNSLARYGSPQPPAVGICQRAAHISILSRGTTTPMCKLDAKVPSKNIKIPKRAHFSNTCAQLSSLTPAKNSRLSGLLRINRKPLGLRRLCRTLRKNLDQASFPVVSVECQQACRDMGRDSGSGGSESTFCQLALLLSRGLPSSGSPSGVINLPIK